MPLHQERLAVGDLLEGVATRFAPRAETDRSVAVEPSGDAFVVGDRLRLEQAVGNLVENALRYGAGNVRLSSRLDDSGVELHVTDDGPGLPAGFASSAFDRFTRADPARSRGGAGLGLSIVRAVARAHGGEAHLRNREPMGLDAWLTLPRPAGRTHRDADPAHDRLDLTS
jgi:signal transduction histidine kinase